MQYRFKVVHENEDPIFTDWREDILHPAASSPRIPHLLQLHGEYPLAAIETEFQGGPPDSAQYEWLECPFKDKETSERFAEVMTTAGYKVRHRDGICIAVGGPRSLGDDLKKLVRETIKLLAK